MKKKLLIILALVLTIAVTVIAAACGNGTPAQSVLFNTASKVWGKDDGREILLFDVVRGETTIGTYEMTGECVIDVDIAIGDEKVEKARGTYFTSRLSVSENGVDTEIVTQSYLNTRFMVQKSYRKTTTVKEGVTTISEIIGTYNEDDYVYVYKVNGEEKRADEISHGDFTSSAYADNDFIYQLARLISVTGALSFDVPYYNYDVDGALSNVTMETVSAAVIGTTAPSQEGEEAAKGFTGMRGDFADGTGKSYFGGTIGISLTRDFPGSGTSFTCDVITSVTEDGKNTALTYPLPGRITEDEITYLLKSETRE